ncbi:ribosomal protein L11 methyltransferase [Prevotella sp. tc2-28]|uniref:50S ribosomal protein L11 methyltransferase n=1 Tax=Prevotella sp. tc2-28 TaxID=1761888 RepID=UPI000898224A|nr:50S ribosomal protein L11 methyltransferase [Prevotella sp. tc2-28]SEA26492.1 ribosomal protein L11 methyltransferase [Prevotella sp. tc2-28]
MKYYEVELTITPCTQDAQDLLSALSAEAGFESFEETATGLLAYAQQSLFDQEVLDAAISTFPIEGTKIIYNVREAEDRDWNEQWEQEGFEPIEVRSQKEDGRGIIIHDGRHLGNLQFDHLLFTIEIDAHQAFGTGTHETTRMICANLMAMDLRDKHVLDCGSGTGILGICALKLGAGSVVAYDIDEWSTDNTRHNAVINGVDDRLASLCGDATLLDSLDQRFDLVLANINRNILLQDMPRFVSVMAPGATLMLSGFYESDCALLESKAQQLGLSLQSTKTDGDWACMVFTL